MVTASPASHIFFSQQLRLHYIDWRHPDIDDGPVMVLVHGIHDHCRTWDHLAERFAARYRVIAPDLRGHGDSEWVKGSSYRYLDYIYDLHQLIDQAGFGPVVLVGHSMGGAVAALFAGIYPELVSKLVVIEGIGLWRAMQPPEPVANNVRAWVEATRALSARLPRRYADINEAFRRMQQANPQLSDEQALHLTVHGSNQNEDGTYSWKYDNYTHNFTPAGFETEETIELWRNITAPTLILLAERGLEHRIGHDSTEFYFRDHELQMLKGAGHWTYHDQPRQVYGLMDNFL